MVLLAVAQRDQRETSGRTLEGRISLCAAKLQIDCVDGGWRRGWVQLRGKESEGG